MDAHTVYLLHFSQRYKHAGHYLGSSHNLTKRLHAHAKGQGARLLAIVHAAGITWTLARTWEGANNVNDNLNDRAAHPAAVRSAKAWGLSWEEWLAYE